MDDQLLDYQSRQWQRALAGRYDVVFARMMHLSKFDRSFVQRELEVGFVQLTLHRCFFGYTGVITQLCHASLDERRSSSFGLSTNCLQCCVVDHDLPQWLGSSPPVLAFPDEIRIRGWMQEDRLLSIEPGSRMRLLVLPQTVMVVPPKFAPNAGTA